MLLAGWARLSRWPEWAQSKLTFSGAAALLLVSPSWPVLLAVMGTISLWAAFGYGVNEVADRRSDRAAGKPNRAAALPAASRMAFLFLTAGGALGLSLVWAADAAAPVLVSLGLAVALAYSLPPIRLKEMGAIGLAGGAIAQWSLPVLAVTGAQPRGWAQPASWTLALLGFALGIRWMSIHQRRDAAADRRAAVSTYASRAGDIERVLVTALACEPALLLATLVMTWPRSIPAVVALVVWLAVELTLMRLRFGPLRARALEFEGAPLAGYYFVIFPLALAVGHARAEPGYWIVVAVFLALSSPYLARVLRARPRRPPAARRRPAHPS